MWTNPLVVAIVVIIVRASDVLLETPATRSGPAEAHVPSMNLHRLLHDEVEDCIALHWNVYLHGLTAARGGQAETSSQIDHEWRLDR